MQRVGALAYNTDLSPWDRLQEVRARRREVIDQQIASNQSLQSGLFGANSAAFEGQVQLATQMLVNRVSKLA
jgi:hypothetical protein